MASVDKDSLKRFRRVTVMGLGLFGGGAGAARFFAGLGAAVTVTDTASAEKLAPSVRSLAGLGIRFALGRHDEADFTNADLVVANQAVRPDNPFLAAAERAGVPVASETGLALALNPSPWIGVTGSSGKSTTASLLAAMLRKRHPDALFGGNIGGDLLTRVVVRSASAPLVAELSSFQLLRMGGDLEEGRIRPPAVAVVTNISPNHLDWHAGMDEYLAAKFNLLKRQQPRHWAVLNTEDPRLSAWADIVPGRVVSCGLADPEKRDACFIAGREIALRLDGEEKARLSLDGFRLMGRHNLANAVEAVAAAFAAGVDAGAAGWGLAEFPGLPHRLEAAGTAGGKRFVNDSKATTPEAAVTALEAVDAPCVLLAGGYDKLLPFDRLGEVIQARAAGLVLIGAAGPRIAGAVGRAAAARPSRLGVLPVRDAGDDFRAAVRWAFEITPPGGTVLLSPACASYGMFVNYEERGDLFRELARELGG